MSFIFCSAAGWFVHTSSAYCLTVLWWLSGFRYWEDVFHISFQFCLFYAWFYFTLPISASFWNYLALESSKESLIKCEFTAAVKGGVGTKILPKSCDGKVSPHSNVPTAEITVVWHPEIAPFSLFVKSPLVLRTTAQTLQLSPSTPASLATCGYPSCLAQY